MAVSLTSDSSRLKDVYERGFKLHKEIEDGDTPSASESVQDQICKAIACFRQCTEMVNQLEMFSSNEEIDEVPTAELRYLLLPALLGDLTLSKVSDERTDNVRIAKIYFIDFLKRCQNYGLTEEDISVHCEDCENLSKERKGPQQLESSRQAKIARYKQKKQQEQKLKELTEILFSTGQSVDEDTQREYAVILIKLWINKSIDHLSSIESELEILEHMEKMRKQNGGKQPELEKAPPRTPMKPILITREMIKSNVFGAGYSSLPTMSQEEMFEKEVREGKIVLEYKSESKSKKDEEEEDSKEDDDDDDDDEKLAKARAWDDWKDDHRRGWGNTYNKG